MLLGVIDDFSLMVMDRNIEIIGVKVNILRVELLPLLRLEKLYAKEAKYEEMNVDTIHG